MRKFLLFAALTALTLGMNAQTNDPHNSGCWFVLIDKYDQEQWYELYEDDFNLSYTSTFATNIELYGVLDDPWADYPDIPLFFVIDGRHYGPAEDMEAVNLYNDENFAYNPLYNNDNRYALPVGFRNESYNIGIDIDPTSGDYRMFVQYSPLGDQEILCRTPSISYRTTNDAVIVTATSNEGVVRMTVDGEIVDNPYTITRGAEDVTVTVTAKARVYYKPESEPATMEITVPARDTTHDTGYWVVLIDKDGNEVWHELYFNTDDYDFDVYLSPRIELYYDIYGGFDPEVEDRPNVCFNFVINGVRYGAEEDMLCAVRANPYKNPLYVNNYFYTVLVGFPYKFGITYDQDGAPYALVEQLWGWDPHEIGHWVVLINKYGGEVWHELIHEEENSYLNHVALDYTTYGVFDPEAEERPNVCFNFSIDGVRYGAQEDRTPAIIGMAIDNPLFHNFNCYTVPVGYNYSFGVCYDYEGNPYAYVDHYSHVDEMGDDGKVASTVRFYNIMGQEIQEPEGLTIQVTTYTDGSTTATKVFK